MADEGGDDGAGGRGGGVVEVHADVTCDDGVVLDVVVSFQRPDAAASFVCCDDDDEGGDHDMQQQDDGVKREEGEGEGEGEGSTGAAASTNEDVDMDGDGDGDGDDDGDDGDESDAPPPRVPTVIVCHGLFGHKNGAFLPQLTRALLQPPAPPMAAAAAASAGVSTGEEDESKNGEDGVQAVVRFDSRGNGGSGGQVSLAGYGRDVRDLQCVVTSMRGRGLDVRCIVGHSRGGNVVLLHAARVASVARVVALAPRFHMPALPTKYLSAEQLAAVADPAVGRCTLSTRSARHPTVPVTAADVKELRSMDMRAEVASLRADCRVLLCHGTADTIIPHKDSGGYAAANDCIHVNTYEGADHFWSQAPLRAAMLRDVCSWVRANTGSSSSSSKL